MKSLAQYLLFVLSWALLSPGADAQQAHVDYDTTRIRSVQPIKKSIGEKIADIPGEILKLPVYTFDALTQAIVMNPPVSSLASLFRFKADKKRPTPVIGFSTRAGLKVGLKLRLLTDRQPSDWLKIKSYYSTNSYQLYRLRFNTSQFVSSRIGLNLSAYYKKETRQSFYGIGMTSIESNEVNIALENSFVQAAFPARVSESVSIRPYVRAQITNVFDGRDPNLEGRLGIIRVDTTLEVQSEKFDPLRHVDLGLALEIDRRNSVSRPTGGSHLLGDYHRLIGIGRSDGRNFDMFRIEVQSFFQLWRQRVLAVRAFFSRTDAVGANDKAIPYYLANRLGGEDALRGFTKGRFTDNDAAYVSTEYRYPIYEHIDAFIFWDGGRVYRDITKDAVFANWRHAGGFGLRIWSAESVLAIVQIARSGESTRFYFDFGASW